MSHTYRVGASHGELGFKCNVLLQLRSQRCKGEFLSDFQQLFRREILKIFNIIIVRAVSIWVSLMV